MGKSLLEYWSGNTPILYCLTCKTIGLFDDKLYYDGAAG